MSARAGRAVNLRFRAPRGIGVAAAALVAAMLAALATPSASARSLSRPAATTAAHAMASPAVRLGADAPLLPLLRALAVLEAGRRGTAPVLVLQIGDSHTANDAFSGRLREVLQARFGNGGRGLLPPGIPYAYYRPTGVHVEAEGWLRIGSFDKPRPAGTSPPPGADSAIPGIFGATGLRQHAMAPATMTYTVDDPADLQRIAVEVMVQPRGGHLDVLLDGLPIGAAATAGAAVRAAWWQPPGLRGPGATGPGVTGGGHVLTLHARGDGPVDVMAVLIARAQPGLIWSNLGTIGATVDLVGAWDRATVADELARLRPAAVALAFGTNEGFDEGLATERYGPAFAVAAARLLPPRGALAVIGPPDGNRRAAGGAPQMGETRAADCGPAVDAHGGPAGAWTEPRHLGPVRAAQMQVARADGYWFWDWSDAMGGACSMNRWTTAQPPLAYDDHVHLRAPGYRQTAEALASAILDAYRRYRGYPQVRALAGAAR